MSKAPSKRRRGRPSKFTPEVAKEICDRIATGEPLAAICRDAHMPGVQTVNDWRAVNAEFSGSIAQARLDGFDALAAECLAIAEDGSRDWVERKRRDGSTYQALDDEHVQRSKLRIETRLKLLAKWDPKRFGDRVTHAGDPDQPVSVEVKPAAVLAKELVDILRQGKAGA